MYCENSLDLRPAPLSRSEGGLATITVMDDVDSLGLFWIPGTDPETAGLSGRLTIGPSQNGRLRLVGQFDDLDDDTDNPQKIRLYGYIGSKEYTLLDCWHSGSKKGHPGITESTYVVGAALKGGHLDGEIQFDKGWIQSTAFPDWIGERVLDSNRTSDRKRPSDWLRYERPRTRRSEIQSGHLELFYGFSESTNGSTQTFEFKHWPAFQISYSELRPLEEINRDLHLLESLTTLCVDAPSSTQSLSYSREDVKVRLLSGGFLDHPQDFEYIASQIRPPEKPAKRHSSQMVATFEEIGGIDTVARFYEAAPTFRRSLDSLMSVKIARQMYTENRFLNVAFAAESFHRDIYGGESIPAEDFDKLRQDCAFAVDPAYKDWLLLKLQHANEMTLRGRLNDLVERAGSAAVPFIDYPKRWTSVLVGVRNRITHLTSSKSDFEGPDLVYLSESLYALVRGCILIHVGVDPEIVAARANHWQIAWYGDRVNEAVSRLRKLI